MRFDWIVLSVSFAFTCGCSSEDPGDDTSHAGANSGGSQQSGGASAGGTSSGGASGGTGNMTGGNGGTGNTFSGGDCPAELGFPAAEVLPNVRAEVSGTTARILFDPRGGAKDYRVYLMPQAGEVSGDTVTNATYRCAGIYEVPPVLPADSPTGNAIRTLMNGMVQGYARTEADALLGYVFTTPGDDRIPVYAMGDPNPRADNVECYEPRWVESRNKKYVTSEDERAQLRAQHWRDDGAVFYVPKPDAAGTTPLYRAVPVIPNDYDGPLYVSGAEYTARAADANKQVELAFSVYTDAQPGSEPLKRIHYTQVCARSHDELIPTEGRFEKGMTEEGAAVQELHFSGITEGTKLVVEALDSLCPFQGVVSPMSRPARDDPFGDFTISYPQFLTPDEVRATSATGELFINGQGDGGTPHATARACLTLSPVEPPASDWSYDGAPETYTSAEQAGFQIWTMNSPTFDFQIHTIATDEWGIGSLFGELWLTYADWAADTNGKMRITPKTGGSMSAGQFLYSTMQVDAVSSDRRYPQMFISDRSAPIQDDLENGTSILVQTRGGVTSPVRLDIQYCDHRTWDVNNQCPQWETYVMNDGEFISGRPEINQFMASDAPIKFEVYASTQRVYVYTNGLPYACVELPGGTSPEGPASVTYGDVLYHSGVDLADWYKFHTARLQTQTTRHFSNLSFSSAVAAPAWDETAMPCSPASTLEVR